MSEQVLDVLNDVLLKSEAVTVQEFLRLAFQLRRYFNFV